MSRYKVTTLYVEGAVRFHVHRPNDGLVGLFTCVPDEELEILEALRARLEGPRLRLVKGGGR